MKAAPQLRIGAHIDAQRPLELAAQLGADCVQFFITKPQGWEKPQPRADAAELRASDICVYVHASYLVNVCSPRTTHATRPAPAPTATRTSAPVRFRSPSWRR